MTPAINIRFDRKLALRLVREIDMVKQCLKPGYILDDNNELIILANRLADFLEGPVSARAQDTTEDTFQTISYAYSDHSSDDGPNIPILKTVSIGTLAKCLNMPIHTVSAAVAASTKDTKAWPAPAPPSDPQP